MFPATTRAEDELTAANRELQAQVQSQQRRIERLMHIGRLQSAFYGALIRTRDRDELLREARRLATDLGGFLVVDGNRVAATTLGARDPAVLQDCELLPLLEDMAASLSLVLESLESQAQTRRETSARVTLESRLRTAIEEQQFVLYYQPQVNLSTGEIETVEALLRWRDGGEEPVLPGRFLPLLESSGMIVPVGNWTLLRAVEDLEGWSRAGFRPLRVAVNVSAVQLKQREFARSLVGLAERLAPLTGFALDIEITESTLLEDLEGTSRKLQELRAAGIRVALDDFGTGYSSLGLLSKLPVDVLKIDRSFVAALPDDLASVTLVASIVELASAFDLVTVAEGVETAAQLAALRALRCRQSQGFFHSVPVPASGLEQMLTRGDGSRRIGVRVF